MITILCILCVASMAALFYFAFLRDYELKHFRHNLRPGDLVRRRFGNEYTQVVITKRPLPEVIHFCLEINPRRHGVTNVNMIYPL